MLTIIWILSGVPSLFAMRDMVKKGVFTGDASTNAAALVIFMSGPVGLVLLVASMVVGRTRRRRKQQTKG